MSDKLSQPAPGYERQWVRCKECGRISYYDYVPYSLSTPIMVLPCRHGSGASFHDSIERIDPPTEAVVLSSNHAKEASNA